MTSTSAECHPSVSVVGTAKLPDGRGVCLTCGAEFSRLSNANKHFRTAHALGEGGPGHACHLCSGVYKTRFHLKDHLRSVHSIYQRGAAGKASNVECEDIFAEPEVEDGGSKPCPEKMVKAEVKSD